MKKKKKKKKKMIKGVQLTESLRAAIQDGTYVKLLSERWGDMVQEIDFKYRNAAVAMYGNKYTIMLSEDMPNDRAIVLMFPNHPDKKKRLLSTSKWSKLNAINTELNERFKASLECGSDGGTVRFAFAFGSHIYVCSNVVGTLYLIWAEQVTKKRRGNAVGMISHTTPIVVNMNGFFITQAIFMPVYEVTEEAQLDTIGILKNWPKYLIPKSTPFFICEQDTRAKGRTMVHSMSREAALKIMRHQTTHSRSDAISNERNPLSVDCDDGNYSSSEDVPPMHHSAVDGQIVFEDGTRALGDLTLHKPRGSYWEVRSNAIPDPGLSDCGTHRPGGIYGGALHKSPRAMVSTSSRDTSEDPSSAKFHHLMEKSPWDEDDEEEEEEEE